MADVTDNLELQALLNMKETGFNYQRPRHDQWRENYELARDHVTINRLTQRQSVNMPLMKTTLRSLLKDLDDMPVMEFENLDNDKQAQVFQNEYWKRTLEQNNAELQDIVDKKQDLFFGRTFDEWQIEDGAITFDITDPADMLVDRFVNPYDLDSARYLVHINIFVPLSSLKTNPDYDQKEVQKLEDYFKSELGIVKAQDNQNALQTKNQKLSDMGVTDMDDPVLGETYVQLSMYYVKKDGQKWEGKTLEDQIWVYVEAEEQTILMRKPQEVIIGTTKDHYWQSHFRYVSWADDIDKQDFWTDGIADVVRTPNKVLNAWFSQLVENRTMRNLGMHYYDSSLKEQGFQPSTWEPKPWGWYGIPLNGKNINEVLQKVDVPDLSESLDEMDYVVKMVEKATGATPGQQGINPPSGTPLGTTQIVEGEAKARTKGISKFYTEAWKKRAEKFLKLIEAAPEKLDAVKIYKKGKNTDTIYPREIAPSDWMTQSGYRVRVWSQDEKDSKDTQALTKLQNLKVAMPFNPKVQEIYVRKLAEYADLTPEEVTEIMDTEKQMQMMGQMGQPGQGLPQGVQQPGQRPPQQQPILQA